MKSQPVGKNLILTELIKGLVDKFVLKSRDTPPLCPTGQICAVKSRDTLPLIPTGQICMVKFLDTLPLYLEYFFICHDLEADGALQHLPHILHRSQI